MSSNRAILLQHELYTFIQILDYVNWPAYNPYLVIFKAMRHIIITATFFIKRQRAFIDKIITGKSADLYCNVMFNNKQLERINY